MKSCEEILDLLPDHLPRLAGEALEVHDHLRQCHDCADAADDLAHTLHVLRAQSAPAPALADDFADRVLAALPPAGAPAGRVLSPSWIPVATRAAAALALFTLGLGSARLLDGRRQPGPLAQRPVPVATQRPGASPSLQPSAPWTPAGQPDARGRDLPQVARQPGLPADGHPLARVPDAGGRLRYANYNGGLERYVQEAGLVLRAVDALEQPDARWLDAVALHIHDEALLEQGEQLLIRLEAEADEPQLRRLITGTQMLLLKLRNATTAPTTVRAVRVELHTTGLLEAYDALLAVDAPGAEPRGSAEHPAPGPAQPSAPARTDPL